jgi:hypothetical protein
MHYPYNAIFGRGLLNTFEAALHSGYLFLNIPATFRVISIFDSQKDDRNIEQGFAPGHKNVHFLRKESEQYQQSACPINTEALVEFKKAIEASGDFKKVTLDPRVPGKVICLGIETSPEEHTELLAFLDKNNYVFTWSTSHLIRVSRDIIEHRLQVNLSVKPRKHKIQKMSEEKVEAMKAEVQRLLDAGFIKEVTYPQWLANMVMVCKKNAKWRMCTDFIDWNKCCPKDDFPLTRIDKIVDSATDYEMMVMLDYFSSYHQI